jgi:glycosyltransferase involved in cell wall biosynthesis
MRVAIAAEPIRCPSGLGHFLATGLKWLASLNPTWEFHVVVRAQFASMYRDSIGMNVKFHTWDETPTVSWLRRNVKVWGRERVIRFMKSMPFASWLVQMEDLRAIWKSLPAFDVIWIPYFDIISRQWPVLYENGFIKHPVLLSILDIHPVFYPGDWGLEALTNFYEGFVPFAKHCSRIITHTDFQRSAITKHLGINSDKISMVYLPPLLDQDILLGTNETDYALTLLRYKYGIKKPYLLYPGSGGFTHKNHKGLLLAWHDLKSRMRNDCPILVCTGKDRWSDWKALIKALDLKEYVIFTDLVSVERLSILYKLCTFVIVPTLYEGGASGPVLEGVLSGKPVLCSRIEPIEEQLDAYGVSGVNFFDPADPGTIADVVQKVWYNQRELKDRAKKDQENLARTVPSLWENWATVYSRELAQIEGR